MASLAGVDLGLDSVGYAAGGCFEVDGEVAAHRVKLPSGAVAECFPASRQIRVLLPDRPSWDQVASDAHEAAQQGLDLLAIQGHGIGTLHHGHEGHVLWARRNESVTLRISVLERIGIRVSGTGQVIDSEGRERRSTSPLPRWSPALRYFRLSQAADDVFDAYRNVFLALEALLSELPVRRDGGERKWIRNALMFVLQADQLDLANYVPASSANAVDAFLHHHYEARRCAMFHAKTWRGALLPGSDERIFVVEALESLSRLVIDLARERLDVVFPAGGMTVAGFEATCMAAYRASFQLGLANDPSPPRPEQVTADLEDVDLIELPTVYSGRLNSSGLLHGFTGEAILSERAPQTINSVFSFSDGALTTRHLLQDLCLEGVDQVQVRFAWLLDNPAMPKARFAL